jgi:hypothetical protein
MKLIDGIYLAGFIAITVVSGVCLAVSFELVMR